MRLAIRTLLWGAIFYFLSAFVGIEDVLAGIRALGSILRMITVDSIIACLLIMFRRFLFIELPQRIVIVLFRPLTPRFVRRWWLRRIRAVSMYVAFTHALLAQVATWVRARPHFVMISVTIGRFSLTLG